MSGVAPDPLDRLKREPRENTEWLTVLASEFDALVEVARAARAYTEDEANYERLVTALARLDKDVA